MSELQQRLQQLARAILKIVTDTKSKGTIQPEHELLWRWKVDKFEYGENGITKSNATGEYLSKKTWLKAFLTLGQIVSQTAEFSAVLRGWNKVYPAATRRHLEQFAGAILQTCLSNEDLDELRHQNKDTIRKFLNDLSGGLVVYKGKAELQGVTLQAMNISLDTSVRIRQPTKEDLEKTTWPIGLQGYALSHPSAMLEVELRTSRGSNVLQAEIEKGVALLRLFNVGSIKWTTYETSSDSLIDTVGQGTLTTTDQRAALQTYLIKAVDEPKLTKFWQTMGALLPKDIYAHHSKQINHVTLAYDRYSDAVLHNGILERRIANAIMGLEALFLEDAQELSYRLGLRTSKILSLLGRHPLEIREIMRDCYAIRSAFAHGGHLTPKQRKKLEAKYGSVKKVLHSVLDYLRLSIIVTILSRVSKEEFVRLIDDSLLDASKHQQLQTRMTDAKALLEE